MEEYGIDAEVLSNDVSQRFACSSNVETNPVGRPALKKGRAELVFQGTNIVKTHMIIFPFYIALTLLLSYICRNRTSFRRTYSIANWR